MPALIRRITISMFALLIATSGLLLDGMRKKRSHCLVISQRAMASLDGMPMDVKNAPVAVQQSYQFNVANPDVMEQLPCYCGCGAMGHTSNYACYVSGIESDGTINYDSHALGCSICVDITQDTMSGVQTAAMPVGKKHYADQKTYAQ